MRICVYCSSSDAVDTVYDDAADALGRALGELGHDLVYGGTDVGLMGTLAHAARTAGAHVTGVVPRLFVERGIEDRHADDLVVTDGMAGRKQAMQDHADAFVALPGGFGTLEELMEVLTLKQLGFHRKPIVLLDVQTPAGHGFWRPLLDLFDELIDAGFAKREYARLYHVSSDLADAFRHLDTYEPPEDLPTKWF